MSASSCLSSLPSALGASVWRADELAGAAVGTVASGHAALDAELPGGGWPLGALIELLQPARDAPVWSLLLPAVVARQQASGGAVVLVNPPHEPFLPAFAAAGLPASSVLWLRGETPVAPLWASEQALRCADVAAVLAWLPRARAGDLRRLHAAAALRADSLLFVLRPQAAGAAGSCARLRLRVGVPAAAPVHGAGHPDAARQALAPALCVDILKRRGPPLDAPLQLPAQAPRLRALLAASAPAGAAGPGGGKVRSLDTKKEESHALDRLAVVA